MPPKNKNKKPSSSSSAQPPPPPPSSFSPSAVSAIYSDYNKALAFLSKGNHKKSLTTLQGSLFRHPNSPELLRLQTTVHLHFSSVCAAGSPAAEKQLKYAAESFNLYAAVCPNGIGLLLLYNQMRFQSAKNESNDVIYAEIINQCEQALLVDDAVDPLEEMVLDSEAFKDFKSKQERIKKVKKDLENLIKKTREALTGVQEKEEEKANFETTLKLAEGEVEGLLDDKRKALMKEIEILKDLQNRLILGESSDKMDEMRRLISNNIDVKRKLIDYWRGMSDDAKRRFLVVEIDDITKFCKKNYKMAVKGLTEAIKFAMGNGHKLKFWRCICRRSFVDAEQWKEHVFLEHIGRLSEEEEELLPKEEVSSVCLERILKVVWRPVNIDKLKKLMKGRALSSEEIELELPFCDDVERQIVLEQIRQLFISFVNHNCLAPSILMMVIDYTIEVIQSYNILGIEDLIPDIKHNPMSLWFLKYGRLKEVFDWLQQIHSRVCLSSDHCEQETAELREEEEIFCDRTIVFTDDFSSLVLDEQLLRLRRKLDPSSGTHAAAYDRSSVGTSADEDADKDDCDDFVHWLFVGDEIGKEVESWTVLRTYRNGLANGTLGALQKEFAKLKSFCFKKTWFLKLESASLIVHNICNEELSKRKEKNSGYVPRCFASLLFERLQELVWVTQGDGFFEAMVILEALKHAEAICLENFMLKEKFVLLNTQLSNLEHNTETTDDKEIIEGMLWVADNSVRNGIWKSQCTQNLQVRLFDSLMMKTVDYMKLLEQKFRVASFHDYQHILLNLLKPFLRARLENLVEKEAKKKVADTEATK